MSTVNVLINARSVFSTFYWGGGGGECVKERHLRDGAFINH